MQGGTPGIAHSAGLPNITGTVTSGGGYYQCGPISASGAFYKISSGNNTNPAYAAGGTIKDLGLDASRVSSVYGNSTTVQPKSIESRYVIKY